MPTLAPRKYDFPLRSIGFAQHSQSKPKPSDADRDGKKVKKPRRKARKRSQPDPSYNPDLLIMHAVIERLRAIPRSNTNVLCRVRVNLLECPDKEASDEERLAWAKEEALARAAVALRPKVLGHGDMGVDQVNAKKLLCESLKRGCQLGHFDVVWRRKGWYAIKVLSCHSDRRKQRYTDRSKGRRAA